MFLKSVKGKNTLFFKTSLKITSVCYIIPLKVIWRFYMDYDDSPVSRYSTTIRFVAIALVLVVLFILGLVASKQIVANMTDKPDVIDTKTANTDTSDEQKKKQEAVNKATQEKQAKEKAAKEKAAAAKEEAAAKKAAVAAKAKAAHEAAAASVASTGPSDVASTGPIDTAAYTIAAGGLGYGVAVFVRSRRPARE